MQTQNPQAYQKAMEMAKDKSPEQLKETVMNLAKERGIDINSLAHQYGIKL